MKIAIVHEMLIKLWGAEKVVENWMKNYLEADIFTLLYDEKTVGNIFPKTKIHPQVFKSIPQKIYSLTKKQRLCLPFMARTIESFDFSEYDIVLVSSSGFAHWAITKPETKTIVYYHAPARYMWDWTNEYKKDIKAQQWTKWYILNSLFLKLRQWDFIASKRHDITLVNSKTTQERVWKYFRLKSEVLYPPIETERFSAIIEKKDKESIFWKITEWLFESQSSISWVSQSDFFKKLSEKNYYIILSALTEFKRIDIAIKNFPKKEGMHLIVIWEGNERKNLEEICGENIVFVGAKFGDELVALVQNSLGLIFPGEEDFWIVPIEIMAAGKPVFALKKWGLTESVIAGKTWDFFEKPNGEDFSETFLKFHEKNIWWTYSKKNCKKQAQKFDEKIFEQRIDKIMTEKNPTFQ